MYYIKHQLTISYLLYYNLQDFAIIKKFIQFSYVISTKFTNELQCRKKIEMLLASEIPLLDNDCSFDMDMSKFTPKPQHDIRKSNRTIRGQLPTKYHDYMTFTNELSLLDYPNA
jgi:hypothetical protein